MKKDFKENPALGYITQMTPDVEEIKPIPKGYKVVYQEVKSRRVQIILPPSLYAKAKENAKKVNMSFNEYVCQIISMFVNNEQ